MKENLKKVGTTLDRDGEIVDVFQCTMCGDRTIFQSHKCDMKKYVEYKDASS